MMLRSIAITFSAAVMLASPAMARAPGDIDSQTMTAVVRYALPHLLTAVRKQCSADLPSDGYLATHGDALMTKFSAGADAQWPRARAMLLKMDKQKGKNVDDTLANMPDESLKPFVDGMLVAMVSKELKPERCEQIEHGLALLDPLPADNVAGLVGFLAEIAGSGKQHEVTVPAGTKDDD